LATEAGYTDRSTIMGVDAKPKSSGKSSPRKMSDHTAKRYPEYPLDVYALGYWPAKIGGNIEHFSRWS
jgi:hypothetical protein